MYTVGKIKERDYCTVQVSCLGRLLKGAESKEQGALGPPLLGRVPAAAPCISVSQEKSHPSIKTEGGLMRRILVGLTFQ